MNIFFLDQNPTIAAQCLVDRHVVKMLLESCQMLSTAHRVLDEKEDFSEEKELALYKLTHVNHPSSKWCRETHSNYKWLRDHALALDDEYTHRYGKLHKCKYLLRTYLMALPWNIKGGDLTPIPCAMDDIYKISVDPVVNYRNYYKIAKAPLHKWTNRDKPDWI